MAKEKLAKTKLRSVKKKLKTLDNKKINILSKLISMEKEFDVLSSNISSSEEWLAGLSITNLKELEKPPTYKDGTVRSRLGDMKRRSLIKEEAFRALSDLEKVNVEINITKLDLLSEQVNEVLNKMEGVIK